MFRFAALSAFFHIACVFSALSFGKITGPPNAFSLQDSTILISLDSLYAPEEKTSEENLSRDEYAEISLNPPIGMNASLPEHAVLPAPKVSDTVISGEFADLDLLSSLEPSIHQHVLKYLIYPRLAQEEGLTGMTTLVLHVSKDGTVLQADVLKSSGYSILDESAKRSVFSASPFPKTFSTNVMIRLPVVYQLR